jgi:hypothetical protein
VSEVIFRVGDRVRWFDRKDRPRGIVRAVYPTAHAMVELDDGKRHRISFSYIQGISNRPGEPVTHCEACTLTLDEIGARDLQRCSVTRNRHRWRRGYGELHAPEAQAKQQDRRKEQNPCHRKSST